MDGDEPRDGVRETYNRIASYFVSTREYPWSEVESLAADTTESGSTARALNLGCGGGRHVDLLSEYADEVVGPDMSRGLLDEAAARAAECGFDAGSVQGDASRLPFVGDAFDLAVYVATVHYLASWVARVASLNELARVFDAGGRVAVSTWSTAYDTLDHKDDFDTTVDWTFSGDEMVPCFYHIYAPDEFGDDLDASDLTVVESTVSSGNCYVVVAGC